MSTQAATWLNLEDLVLSEISQSQKANTRRPLSDEVLGESTSYRLPQNGGLPGAGGGHRESSSFLGTVSVLQDETVLEKDGGDGCKAT